MTISVTQLGNFLKAMVDNETLLNDLSVEGEVSNFRQSGEVAFFVLKDANAQVDCFCYNLPKYPIENGTKVIASGRPSYYVKGGKLSFFVSAISESVGKGDKFAELLKLKDKLQKMGCFDELKKKPVCRNCKKIGVVTSAEGAVIHDIINVCRRRNPTVDIFVYDSRVQGVDSEASLIRGLRYFDDTDVDNIIIARGGGSSEDLSSFNGEELVYAITSCKKPVISAVGHETDFTLCDFAADCRASTPSVAAELSTTDISGIMESCRGRLGSFALRFCDSLVDKSNHVDSLRRLIVSAALRKTESLQSRLLFDAAAAVSAMEKAVFKNQSALSLAAARLDESSPLKILQKGFAAVQIGDRSLTSASQANAGDEIGITLVDGKITAQVKTVEVKK